MPTLRWFCFLVLALDWVPRTTGQPYAQAQKPHQSGVSSREKKSKFPNCHRLDGMCPDAHPLMFGDPVPAFFKCKSSEDCNQDPCVRGKCECTGGSLFRNCGAMLMWHREWEAMKRDQPKVYLPHERSYPHPMTYLLKRDQRSAALPSTEGVAVPQKHQELEVGPQATIRVPDENVFDGISRNTQLLRRLYTLTNEWSLVQDIAGKRDNVTAGKLFNEISFLLTCILESEYAKNHKIDLTGLVWQQLTTINTALTWAIKNCLRFNSHNQVKRLGMQEYGRGYFFKIFELLVSASQHPNAKIDVDATGEQFINVKDMTMLQRVTKLMFHELIPILIDAGASTHGTLIFAAQNMDLTAMKLLIEYGGVDPSADDQKDEFGRSPLQVTAANRAVAYEDVFGYLCKLQPSDPVCAPEARNLGVCAYEELCDIKRGGESAGQVATQRESVYLHNVGASLALNCPFKQYDGAKLTVEEFRKDILYAGTPAVLNNITDDWPMHEQWTLETLKSKYGDLQVSVGRIPYGYRFGREYHKEPLRQYVEYLESMGGKDVVDTPQYVFDAEVLEMPAFSNASFHAEDYPQPEPHPDGRFLPPYLHQDRFTWMGDGILNDLYGTVLGPGTNRAHQWFLGPKESGAPLHHHCQAINTMISGRKLWLIFPPTHPKMGVGYSNMEAVMWLRRTAILRPDILTNPEKYGMVACVQEAGQSLFIPTHWTHATINVEPAIGFAAELFSNC